MLAVCKVSDASRSCSKETILIKGKKRDETQLFIAYEEDAQSKAICY